LFIRGFWTSETDCIIDARVTNTDTKSYLSRDPENPRLAQRHRFTPFVVSTDGPSGKEAKCLLKKLSILLSGKWKKPYAVVSGYVNARKSIAIVRATHICLRGSRITTSQMSNRRPQWEDKAGLSHFRNST
jgi:hypothetical protein